MAKNDSDPVIRVSFGPEHNSPESIAKGDLHGEISMPVKDPIVPGYMKQEEPFQVELEEREGHPLIVKAQMTLDYLGSNGGKLTPLQSHRFACYVAQGLYEDYLYRYRYRWFNVPLWPYYAFRRWRIHRWFKRVRQHMKDTLNQELRDQESSQS